MQQLCASTTLKKTITAILLFGTFSLTAVAQSTDKSQSDQTSDNKFFKGVGFGLLSQYESSPVAITPEQVINSSTGAVSTANNYVVLHAYTIYSASYYLRYNIYEPNSNMSISVSASPTLALSIGWITDVTTEDYTPNTNPTPGFLSVEVPAFVEFNMGNISTFNADKEKGFMVGVGYELVVAPIFTPGSLPVPTTENNQSYYGTYTQTTPPVLKTKNLWTEPALEVGYRYWSKFNKGRELNLKYGFGAAQKFTDASGTAQSISPWTIKLSWLIYLNY